jgi:hypothetical protein|tara:strand:+ start:367 stop:1371 length:1005 start_codon:yes stop_codon:yes gene_type:complete
MADSQPTNVVDAGNIIKGLMTGDDAAETPVETAVAESTQTTEEAEVETSSEETVNPSDVPYKDQGEEPLSEEIVQETSESEDIQENSEEPIYTVTIDGTDFEVTQDELIQGYQRNADYTRKTQELAAERQQSSDFVERSKKDVEQKIARLDELNKSAQVQLQQEYAQIDFEKLYDEDPVEAARLEHKMRKKNEQLQQVQQQTNQLQMEEFQKYLDEQQKQLNIKVPEMNHPEQGTQFRKQMRDYLSNMGFKGQEIDSIYDHRYVMLVKDAMNYRNLQKAKPEIKKKAVNAPKVVRGGVSKTKGQQLAEEKRQKLSTLRKTGKVTDAAKIFRSLV